MTAYDVYCVLIVGALLTYPVTAIWMVWRGWLIRAGAVTALIAILPQLWENVADPNFSGPWGYAFLVVTILFRISAFLIVIGLIVSAVRVARRIARGGAAGKRGQIISGLIVVLQLAITIPLLIFLYTGYIPNPAPSPEEQAFTDEVQAIQDYKACLAQNLKSKDYPHDAGTSKAEKCQQQATIFERSCRGAEKYRPAPTLSNGADYCHFIATEQLPYAAAQEVEYPTQHRE